MVVNRLYYGKKDIATPHASHATHLIDADTIAEALQSIYRREFNTKADIEPHLFRAFAEKVAEAVDEGYTANAAPSPDDAFRNALRHSADVFAAFKTHRTQSDMAAQLLDSNGNLKSFEQWKNDVQPIASHQCGAWLETEYNTAVLRARQAADWQQFEAEKDVLPNLKWLPSTSPNPGADHLPFWNTILPIEHPFWNQHRPGDRWNCKCELTSTDEPTTAVPTTAGDGGKGNNPHRGLADNPGKTKSVFSQDHPYFPKNCNACPFYKPGFRAKLRDLFYNQKKNCTGNCPYVGKVIEKTKGKNNISEELRSLKELRGAAFGRKLQEIISRREFKPVKGQESVFSMVGEKDKDYKKLIDGAKKAVQHGYTVYIIPNPKELRIGDYIFVRKGVHKLLDLKTISGKNSADNRLVGSVGQANRVLLNMATTYNPRRLAQNIKEYFDTNPDAKEVLIFKGKREISITRENTRKNFVKFFMKEYGR